MFFPWRIEIASKGTSLCFVLSVVAAWSRLLIPLAALILGTVVSCSVALHWIEEWLVEDKERPEKRDWVSWWLARALLALFAVGGAGMYLLLWRHQPVFAGMCVAAPIVGLIVEMRWTRQRDEARGQA
jgi:hypothetical protein